MRNLLRIAQTHFHMSSLNILLQTNNKVFDFIRMLEYCKINKTNHLILNFKNFEFEDFSLSKKIRFIYTAFSLETFVKSNSILIFNENNQFLNFDEIPANFSPPVFYTKNDFKNFNINDLMINNYEKIILPPKFDHIVLGGTFDRLHNGHRLFLSICTVLAQHSINIGITSQKMIGGKILAEIIQPFEIRRDNVYKYIKFLKNNILINFDELNDRIGFAGTIPILDTLVTTYDNSDAILEINNIRKINNINILETFVLDHLLPVFNTYNNSHIYLTDDKSNIYLQNKILNINNNFNSTQTSLTQTSFNQMSSTYLRSQLMGELINPIRKQINFPYIIGVTGCIASGKTTLCKYLKEFSADVIDCDHEARQCYIPNTKCYLEIVEKFGSDILTPDISNNSILIIDRKKLGNIVFNDHSKMDLLNKIIWPHLVERVKNIIKVKGDSGVKIIVIEATILFESNLIDLAHEIWLCVIPEKTALVRIQERNKVDAEKAKNMYDCTERLISRFEKAKQCNVIFSTHFEADKTKEMAKSAWDKLNQRIGDFKS